MPQMQKLQVGRDEFQFELSNGVLSVSHYAKDPIGFVTASSDPSPVRSLALIPNFLLTAHDLKGGNTSVVMLDIVSLTLSDQVTYTLGEGVEAVDIALIPPAGQEPGSLPLKISLRDPSPNFEGVRQAKFDMFRKIPLDVPGKKIAVPLLPADSIRALLFAKGPDVRMYYVDLNDTNNDEDGYFSFRLEGKFVHVSHFGAKKMRFNSYSPSFELSVPPHPFKIFPC